LFTLTWYGNAAIKVRSGNTVIFFDPFISRNPAFPKLQPGDLADVTAVAATHGHFDHVADFPAVSTWFDGPFLVSKQVERNLVRRKHMDPDRMMRCEFDIPFQLGDCELTMLHGRHVRFDRRLIRKTLPRTFKSFRRASRLLPQQSPVGAVSIWQVRYRGQTLLHLGSLGFTVGEAYPVGADVLDLPMQGHSRIYEKALAAVDQLQPGAVVFHHFDDAFPPVSTQIPTGPIIELLQARHPEVQAYTPEYGIPIDIG
jgi:L-ascorbate metabolism protein UlaG (beta-lactamase superfamily)